ncbi:MAG: FAD-dependent oxidoreductase [Gracilibacteraceae bacterium]|jgi:electron transfer flavoprotein-quinone oxidoreductase|nr:FAD-dependent oxidoreductase [Gracilibacteraceae bacterium]
MSDFETIIVGGGLAGLTTAYILAKEGVETLLIERGNFAGAKNVSGGRIYSHSLEKVIPGFAGEAPLERRITREKISLLTADSAVTADYFSPGPGAPGRDSYSVLRVGFDQWLAGKAEEAGAQIVTGIKVDDLLLRDGNVRGVAAGDEMTADVTVLADGVNALLAKKLGLRAKLSPAQVAVGVKEVIELPAAVIEDRFQCGGEEGTAWLFAGQPSGGKVGGAFLYTNKESLSLGVVCTLEGLAAGVTTLPQMLEDFKGHPAVAPLLAGGKTVEYSAHLVPEGGVDMVPRLFTGGALVVGDAAGFCLNLGYTVRGMDLAVGSGDCAARAILQARRAGDYGAGTLGASYQNALNDSFIMKDMKLYRKFPHFMEKTPRIFSGYPEMASDLMARLFVVDGEPSRPLYKKVASSLKGVGALNLMLDGMKGVRSL